MNRQYSQEAYSNYDLLQKLAFEQCVCWVGGGGMMTQQGRIPDVSQVSDFNTTKLKIELPCDSGNPLLCIKRKRKEDSEELFPCPCSLQPYS